MRLRSPIGNEVDVRDPGKALVYARHEWEATDSSDRLTLGTWSVTRTMRHLGTTTAKARRAFARISEVRIDGNEN